MNEEELRDMLKEIHRPRQISPDDYDRGYDGGVVVVRINSPGRSVGGTADLERTALDSPLYSNYFDRLDQYEAALAAVTTESLRITVGGRRMNFRRLVAEWASRIEPMLDIHVRMWPDVRSRAMRCFRGLDYLEDDLDVVRVGRHWPGIRIVADESELADAEILTREH